MSILNQCSVCGEDFVSVKAFDDHIMSKPSDPIFDCMQFEEMRTRGWQQNAKGRWASPRALISAEQARRHFTSGLRGSSGAVEATGE